VIKNNIHKYSVSAMCQVLEISRSIYYYKSKIKNNISPLIELIKDIFEESRRNYGTRRIKFELFKLGHKISRRRISSIMKQNGLVSKYTIANFKPHHDKVNEEELANLVERNFNKKDHLQVVVSDLTYVRVGKAWNYICVLIDLFNREIIGYSSGKNKDAQLVARAFSKVKGNLQKVKIFHTDRGNEFNNQLIKRTLETFNIRRSLSMKGCPYDNAVAEATFKTIKTEFINGVYFDSLEELNYELLDYVNWFNNHRIHSSLGYQTPVEYRMNNLKKVV
jgi:transposase InsO family protein